MAFRTVLVSRRSLVASILVGGGALSASFALPGCGSSSTDTAEDAGPGTSTTDAGATSDSGATADSGSTSDSGSGDGGSTSDSGTCAAPVVAAKSTCTPSKVQLGVPVSLPYSSSVSIGGLVAADLNNDGKTDIVLNENDSSVGGIDVYLSKGDGTFVTPSVHYNADILGPGITSGDFDGDCNLDIFGGGASGPGNPSNPFEIFSGKGDGTFHPVTQVAGIGSSYLTMIGADLNRDGKLDVVGNDNSDGTDPFGARVSLNKGGDAFAGLTYPTTDVGSPGSIAVGDLTGDGALDIAFVSVDGACVIANSGSGSFGAQTCTAMTTSGDPNKIALADFNGDGKLDIVGETTNPNTLLPVLNVFLNKGTGTFNDRVEYPMTGSRALTAVDINNDGKIDIETFDATSIQVLLNNGDGTFPATPISYPAGGTSAEADEPMVPGDFRGNGLTGFAVNNRANSTVDVVIATCSP